jgi:hypothetical protein
MVKAIKYVRLLTIMAIALVAAVAQAQPIAGNAARLAAIKSANPKSSRDPILQGSSSESVAAGITFYFSSISDTYNVSSCKDVFIQHADGGVFDNANTGKLRVHGLGVSVLFLDNDGDVITNVFLGANSPNNVLYSAGYAVTSPQGVNIPLTDLPEKPSQMEFITEGDVTNTDSSSHTVNSNVNGIFDVVCTRPS